MYALFFIISFGASIIGAICGIGGGVIIKPVLDASGALLPGTINFLSGCTVLAMTCYSVLRNRLSGATSIEGKTAVPLAVGAAVGGLAGKQLFDIVEGLFPTPELAGAVQAVALGIITIGTLVYNLNKSRISTLSISGAAACVVIGFALGVMSSFLGIGGGPINLVVLYFFSAWVPSRRRRIRSSSSCARRRRAPSRAFLLSISLSSIPCSSRA